MQERLSDVLGSAADDPAGVVGSDDEAFEQVRQRVQALISAARTLSDTCADLADALRPVPGHLPEDPMIAGFGRLRAERTAALLDEAASAARGTLGLLHSAYGALDRGTRVGPPAPRSGATTWPDAFVEVPPRAFTVDDEAGTAVAPRPRGRPGAAHTGAADPLSGAAPATDPHGIPAQSAVLPPPADTDPHGIPAQSAAPAAADTDAHGIPTQNAVAAPAADTDAHGVPVQSAPPAAADTDAHGIPAQNAVAPVADTDAHGIPAQSAMPPASADTDAHGPAQSASPFTAGTDAHGAQGARPEPAADTGAHGIRAQSVPMGASDADARGVPARSAVSSPASDTDARGVPAPSAGPLASAGAPDVAWVGSADEIATLDGSTQAASTDAPGIPAQGAGVPGAADRQDAEVGLGLGAPTAAEESVEELDDDPAGLADEGPAMLENVDGLGLAAAQPPDEPLGEPDPEALDGAGLRAWATPLRRPRPVPATADDTRSTGPARHGIPAPVAAGRGETAAAPETAGSGETPAPGVAEPEPSGRTAEQSEGEARETAETPSETSVHGETSAIHETAAPQEIYGTPEVPAPWGIAGTEETTAPQGISGFDEIAAPQGISETEETAAPQGIRESEGAATPRGVGGSEEIPAPQGISEFEETPAPWGTSETEETAAPQEIHGTEETPAPQGIDEVEEAPALWRTLETEETATPREIGGSEDSPAPQGISEVGEVAAPRGSAEAVEATEPVASIGEHARADEPQDEAEPEVEDAPADPYTPEDVDGEGLRGWASPAKTAALAGWIVVDPDDEDDPGHPIRTVAAAQAAERLTVPVEDPDGAGWHGDTVSAEPRSLSLVPPVREDESAPMTGEVRMPAAADPWAAEPSGEWSDPLTGADLSGAAAFARPDLPVWTAEPVPGASAAGDGVAVYPIGAPEPAQAARPVLEAPLDEPAAAVISRQVEAARRHLQAALVVANGPSAPQRLGALLTAVEQVLTAVTDLARETRGLLESGLADRTFPGEARFLCSPPWEGATLVSRDSYGDDVASPAGLARLLRSLGYEAHSITSAGGVAGVQIRSARYAMQVALVEPAGGGRQRWSGALEWADSTGAKRTWAETLGPVELEDEELARRVDELVRRSVGSV